MVKANRSIRVKVYKAGFLMWVWSFPTGPYLMSVETGCALTRGSALRQASRAGRKEYGKRTPEYVTLEV